MADEIITIATLEIDSSKAIGTIEQTKKSIWDLQTANTNLRKEIKASGDATGEQTALFVANEQEIKRLNAVYKEQTASLNSVTLAQLEESAAYKESAKSIAQAEAQNKELLALKKQINLTTPEGIKAMELINKKTDENTRLIKSNDNADQARQSNIGKYPQVMGSLASSIGGVTGQIGGATSGIIGMGKAFAAAPIGLVLLLFQGLVNLFKEFDPIVDKIEQSLSGMSAAFDVVRNVVTSLFDGTKSLSESFDGLGDSMAKAAKDAAALKEAQQDLQDQLNIQEVSNAKASQQYDELIVKSKNRTLTEKERLELLQQAEKIEEQNFKQRSALADAELNQAIEGARIKGQLSKQELDNLKRNTVAYASALLNRGKISDKEFQAIKDAELGKIAIQAESTKRLEKNQNAQDKLADDAAAKAEKRQQAAEKAAADAAKKREEQARKEQERKLKALQDSIVIFENEQHSAEAQIAFYEKYYDKLNKLQGGKDRVKNAQDLSVKLLSISEQAISEELKNQEKLNAEKKRISQEERDELVLNSAFLRSEQLKRLDSAVLSAKDRAKALEEIELGYNESVKAINQSFADAEAKRREEEKALAQAQSDLRLQLLIEQGAAETDIQKAILDQQLIDRKAALDEDFANNKRTAEEVTTLKTLEDKKYAQATKKIDDEISKQKKAQNLGMVKDSLNALSAIFGENKAVAVAAALVNTYEGISAGVKLGYPAAIPAVAAAAATGFAAVKNILSTKKGDTGGSSDVSGGNSTSVFASPAKTDTVAKLEALPGQQPLTVAQPVLILEHLDEAQRNQIIKLGSNG